MIIQIMSTDCIIIIYKWLGFAFSFILFFGIPTLAAFFMVLRYIRSPPKIKVPPLQTKTSDITDSDHRMLEPNTSNKIIIIGGGAAGLFAAYTCEYLGLDYDLLEASDNRLGGRVRELNGFWGNDDDNNNDNNNIPLDIGAEWIHCHDKILQDLLLFHDQKVDVKTIQYNPQTFGVWNGKTTKRYDFIRFFYQEYKFYNTTWFSYLQNYVIGYLKPNKIHMGAVVSTVDYSSDDQVQVTTVTGETYIGDKAIVAVPLAILKNRKVEFIPAMPNSKQVAIDKAPIRQGFKLYLEFDNKFYPDIQLLSEFTLSNYYNSNNDDEVAFVDVLFRKDSPHFLLCFLQVGESDAVLKEVRMNEKELVTQKLDLLDQMFNGVASKSFIRSFLQNWSNEPYIQGAYSGYHDMDYPSLEEPLLDDNNTPRIYFAGEYLAQGKSESSVHGAAIAGRVAVDTMIQEWK